MPILWLKTWAWAVCVCVALNSHRAKKQQQHTVTNKRWNSVNAHFRKIVVHRHHFNRTKMRTQIEWGNRGKEQSTAKLCVCVCFELSWATLICLYHHRLSFVVCDCWICCWLWPFILPRILYANTCEAHNSAFIHLFLICFTRINNDKNPYQP